MLTAVTRSIALVLVLASSADARAQVVEASRDEDRVGLAIFTGVVVTSATWIVTAPWRGFWHEREAPGDWRSWVSALAVGAAAGVSTGFTTPNVRDALLWQAAALGVTCAAEVLALMIRTMAALAESCNEICHKLALSMPLFVGLVTSFVLGQVLDAELGPATMTAPLVIAF